MYLLYFCPLVCISPFHFNQTHNILVHKQIPLWGQTTLFRPSLYTFCSGINEIISLCQYGDKICIDRTSQSRVAVLGPLCEKSITGSWIITKLQAAAKRLQLVAFLTAPYSTMVQYVDRSVCLLSVQTAIYVSWL